MLLKIKIMIEIIGYPEGNIIEVNEEKFNLLFDNKLIVFDDEWCEEQPNGQWSFNSEDEDKIITILKL